jgi:hypothetical protein
VKVWCFFGEDGRIVADSDFRTAEDVWRIVLGWPTKGEVRKRQERGARVEQIDIPAVGKTAP